MSERALGEPRGASSSGAILMAACSFLRRFPTMLASCSVPQVGKDQVNFKHYGLHFNPLEHLVQFSPAMPTEFHTPWI